VWQMKDAKQIFIELAKDSDVLQSKITDIAYANRVHMDDIDVMKSAARRIEGSVLALERKLVNAPEPEVGG